MKKEYYIKYYHKHKPDKIWYIFDIKTCGGSQNIEKVYLGTKEEIEEVGNYLSFSAKGFSFFVEKASQDLLDMIALRDIIT